MKKRYIIFEENPETGHRTEVGQANDLFIDNQTAIVRDRAEHSGDGQEQSSESAPDSTQAIRINGGDQTITITIQIAPAHPHHQGHGGCSDCNRQR